jgi:hypothetical protein
VTAERRHPRQFFGAREIVVIALVGALIAISKGVLRIPMKVPGHTGIVWMALFVVGWGMVRKPWAGIAIGMISGVLAVALAPGQEGLLIWIKYAAPGVVFDVAGLAFGATLTRAVPAVLIGAIANVAKLLANLALAVLLGLPAGFLAVGLGLATVTHVVFGALGGWVGSVVFARLAHIRAAGGGA